MSKRSIVTIVLLPLGLNGLVGGLAQPPHSVQAKRTISAQDCRRWESLGDAAISDDGQWCAYLVHGPRGGRLIVRQIDSEREYEISSASSPVFASSFPSLAYQLPGGKLGVMNLDSGTTKTLDDIRSPIDVLSGGDYLLSRGHPKGKDTTFDLVHLKDASRSPLEATRAAAQNATGQFLVLTVLRNSTTRIELLNLKSMDRKILYQTEHRLADVLWTPNDEAILTTETVLSSGGPRDVSIAILRPLASSPVTERFDPADHAEFPHGRRLAGPLVPISGGQVKAYMVPTVSAAATVPGVPGKPKQEKVTIRRGDDPIVRSLRPSDSAVEPPEGVYLWLPGDHKMLPLPGEPIRPNLRYALSYRTSRIAESWNFLDLYVTDLHNGTTTLLADQAEGADRPEYPVVLYFQKGHWWEYNANTGQTTNLTKGLAQSFAAPAYGSFETRHACNAEPLSDGTMLLAAQYDLYLWKFGAGLRRLTDGARDRTVYRLAKSEGQSRTDPDGTPRARLFFTAFNERTKAHGFAILEPGAEKAELKVLRDRKLEIRAKARDRLLVLQSSFTESPNLFVTDSQCREWKPISDLNAHQKEYHWSRAELVSYRSSWGADLGGVLLYPARFVPGKQYPMVVYVYELQSERLHDYVFPDEGDWANEHAWTQRGYFVLKPDIDYQPGKPGLSAVDCVEAAVNAVLKKGLVDPKKIGLMGTSFGGYETTFILGKSSTFAAGVALNPVTNLVSFHSSQSGAQGIYQVELGQFRMGAPFWQDLPRYVENSPIFQAKAIASPLLLVHGDKDQAVSWQQSRELYEAMQRLSKKNVTFLLYPGIGHGPFGPGLAQRMRHFFDVHLRGAPPEHWLATRQN